MRRLVEQGLLPSAAVRPYAATGAIPDAAWDQVRRLIGLLEPQTLEEDCWAIDMSASDQGPRLVAAYELPAADVLDALNLALAGGWQVVSVERTPDDEWFADDECREEAEGAVAGDEQPLSAEDGAGCLRALRYHLVHCG